MTIKSKFDPSEPLLVRLPRAAELSGVPLGWLQKSFMETPPKGTPPCPPHIRLGRSIYIIAAQLPEWVASLQTTPPSPPPVQRSRGRPRKADAIASRHGQ